MAFILQFVEMVYRIDLQMLKIPFHPWDEFHLIVLYDLFNVLLVMIASILLRIFVSMFIHNIDL